jgi:ATP-dependent exoDNAse (exonuclease V) beta subunit
MRVLQAQFHAWPRRAAQQDLPHPLGAARAHTLQLGLLARYGIELAAGGAPRSITGHIDFLQVRNDAVHILDYKPDARTNKPIAQLAIYALALTIRVPGLKLFDIKCAWFNEEEYNEFFPRTLFAKRQK